MAREKLWYKIRLDNGIENVLLATVKSKGLAVLTLNYYKTVYPEDRHFRVWMEA